MSQPRTMSTDSTQLDRERRRLARGWARRRCSNGEVAVVTLAAGAGSRWTQGAGVVKALHPFCKLGGTPSHLHRRRTWPRAGASSRQAGTPIPHIFTTSYLTHDADRASSSHAQNNYGYEGPLFLSPGTIGRPAHDPDGARPALRLGGDAAADARRAAAESARQPAPRADQLGAQRRRRQRLHRQSAAAMPASGRPLVSRCPTCSATACWRGCWPSVRS